MSLFKKKNQRPKLPESKGIDKMSIKRTEEFIPHFVYSNNDKKVVDSIYLTDEQAYELNKLMKRKGSKNQDLVFLRK